MESRTVDQIDYPKTKDEWWALLELHHIEMLNLIDAYHPWYRSKHDDVITARMAERVCEAVREAIVALDVRMSPADRFSAYKSVRDEKMADLLNETWFGMPESMDSRCQPGFGVLCDLFSEAYVLYDGESEHEEA
jgi:hypothetical protein